MRKEVVVVDANKEQRTDLCCLLQKHGWKTAACGTFQELEKQVGICNGAIVIINLDNISVDNKRIRKLKMNRIYSHIIAFSAHPYHPELEEVFREHISVSMSTPVDPDELMYWLKIFDP